MPETTEEKAAREAKEAEKAEAEKKLKEAEDARRKAEDELKGLRKAEDDLKRKKDEDELKAKGDYTTLLKKLEEDRVALAEQSKRSAIDTEVMRLSIKAGLKKDAYLALLDRSTITVTDGKVVGADKAFEKFQKDNPDLFKGESDDGGETGGSTRVPKKNDGDKTMVDDIIKEIDSKRKARLPIGWPTN
jgi:hypothetical protein